MQIGFWQIAIVVLLVVLLFGRGKISDLMGDVAKGITNFKKGIADGDKKPEDAAAAAAAVDPKAIPGTPEAQAATAQASAAVKPGEPEKKPG
jgi:sec-independent protein translocase protein TatA